MPEWICPNCQFWVNLPEDWGDKSIACPGCDLIDTRFDNLGEPPPSQAVVAKEASLEASATIQPAGEHVLSSSPPRSWRELIVGPSVKSEVSIAAGCIVFALGAGLLILVFAGFFFNARNGGLSGTLLAGGLGVLGVIASVAFVYARRLLAPTAEQRLAEDARPPILLLRAFADDNREVVTSTVWNTLGVPGTRGTWTFEEALCQVFETHGPVIAVGRPGEMVPPLGAARLWLEGDHWQEGVEDLLQECQRVVMIMGACRAGEGLAWEAMRVLRPDIRSRLVLVMPPVNESKARDIWEQFRAVSNDSLPAYCGGEMVATQHADGSWQVVRVPGGLFLNPRKNMTVYRNAIRRQMQVKRRKEVRPDIHRI
jgi:hypothetical protein